jgi:hypothetical protein
MYRLPLYGQLAVMCEASATLWYLKGLKSSLMCSGTPFFGARVPKNGLGGPEGVELDSEALGLGEAVDVEATALLPPEVLDESEFLLTGLNEFAFTFSTLPPGERGVLGPVPFWSTVDVVRIGGGAAAEAAPDPLAAAGPTRLPLNGGIS